MADLTVRDLYGAWEKAHAHLVSIATEQGRARNELLPARSFSLQIGNG